MPNRKTQNTRLAKKLIAHTKKIARQVNIPLFTAFNQSGNTFGERLSNAVEDVFLHEVDKVIIIGNDSPNLKASHIEAALTNCTTQNMVLGPSLDGGVYLIGLHRKQFNANIFKALAWETASLMQGLMQYADNLDVESQQLEYLQDLDSATDVLSFLKNQNKNHVVVRIIIALFQYNPLPYLKQVFIAKISSSLQAIQLRAP